MNLLFTGAGRRIELIQAFRGAALVLGKPLRIFGADLAGTAPSLSYCDEARDTSTTCCGSAGRTGLTW